VKSEPENLPPDMDRSHSSGIRLRRNRMTYQPSNAKNRNLGGTPAWNAFQTANTMPEAASSKLVSTDSRLTEIPTPHECHNQILPLPQVRHCRGYFINSADWTRLSFGQRKDTAGTLRASCVGDTPSPGRGVLNYDHEHDCDSESKQPTLGHLLH
jgi:hypothetical protein